MVWLTYIIVFFSIYPFECCQDFPVDEQCQIPLLQIYSPVHTHQSATQGSTSKSGTTSDSYVTTSTESTNSDECQAATTTTAVDIAGAEQHQQQFALDNFQLPRWQNAPRQVNKNYCVCQFNSNCLVGGSMFGKCPRSRSAQTSKSTSAASLACSSFARDQNAGWEDAANYFECSRISMSWSNPDQTDACGVSSTNQQQISTLGRIESVHIGNQIFIQLERDNNKWEGVVTAVHAAGSTPDRHSQVTESGTPNRAMAATSTTTTSAESQPSNSELSSPLKMQSNSESKKKRYVCNYPGCNKVCSSGNSLKDHSRKHSGERHFFCDWTSCGKSFYSNSNLKRHRNIHTGGKRFQCPICSKEFRLNSYLSRHMKTHRSKRN